MVVGRTSRFGLVLVLALSVGLSAWAPAAYGWSQVTCNVSGQAVKWPTTSIRYSAFGGSYGSTITASRNAWNNAQSSVTLTAVSPTSGNPHFNVVIANLGNQMPSGITRKPGTTSSYPGCSGGTWTTGQMETVTNTYDGTGAFRLQNTTVHEIGHALSLAHNSATFQCNGGPGLGFYSIMYPTLASASGDCRINTPRTDDSNGVNAIY